MKYMHNKNWKNDDILQIIVKIGEKRLKKQLCKKQRKNARNDTRSTAAQIPALTIDRIDGLMTIETEYENTRWPEEPGEKGSTNESV